jgi:hypothetical protein
MAPPKDAFRTTTLLFGAGEPSGETKPKGTEKKP